MLNVCSAECVVLSARILIMLNVCVFVDATRWRIPPVFSWLQEAGGLSEDEMGRTFNVGLGAVLVVASPDAQRVLRQLQAHEQAWIVGSLIHKQPGGSGVYNDGTLVQKSCKKQF